VSDDHLNFMAEIKVDWTLIEKAIRVASTHLTEWDMPLTPMGSEQ